MERLEERLLLAFDPTGMEQELLERVNRMRIDPQAELDWFYPAPQTPPADIEREWQSLTPAAPLAWHESLYTAARGHSQALIAADEQSHQLPGEDPLDVRITKAGYDWSDIGENVFAYAQSVADAHEAFAVDNGVPDRGHRINIMNADYREVGIAVLPEGSPATEVGPLVVTQDFGNRFGFGFGNPYLLGVVYSDGNANGQYDAGEGYGNVRIDVTGPGVALSTTSMTAGGYQLQVPAGTYTVRASGGALGPAGMVSSVVVGSANVKVDFDAATQPAAEALGSIDFLTRAHVQVAGEQWYSFQTTQGNWLAIDATGAAGGTSTVTLYNEARDQQIAQGSGYLAAQVEQSTTYFLKLTGQNADLQLRISNLVDQQGGNVTVYGTAGDDAFEYDLAQPGRIVINQVPVQVTSSQAAAIAFDGGDGRNTATLRGTSRVETATLQPLSATLEAEGAVVTVARAADITIYGGGGSDTATLGDSAGNDNFVGSPTYAAMDGAGFYNRAWNFADVSATAGQGIDVAKFFDSTGNDTYVATPTCNVVSGPGYRSEAWYFEGTHVYATAGGVDVAKFYDSPGRESFVATPTYAALFNTTYVAVDGMHGFYNRAKFFEATHAFATAGGIDEARLYDSAADDTFNADPSQGVLFNPTYRESYTNGFYNRAKYFEGVHAFATAGGHDRAMLYDSPGNDSFYGDPIQGALFNPSFAQPYTNSFYNRAKFFEEVTAYSTAGGGDVARFYDSTGDDTFNAGPSYAELFNTTYRESYTYGFHNRAESFASVQATGGKGGNDAAGLFDSALADLLQADAHWARLSNSTLGSAFNNLVQNFAHVTATSQNSSGDVKQIAQTVDFVLDTPGAWEAG